ncbi:3-oxo-5-alpha-steroid 4-dehydrogenase 2a [Neosynchiropus ocellatus]
MDCWGSTVSGGSWALLLMALAFLHRQRRIPGKYGRYAAPESRCCPARLGWFLQELPSFLLPLVLLLLTDAPRNRGATEAVLLLFAFILHYFQRAFIYSFLTRGRPVPRYIVWTSAMFCSFNGLLQGHYLLHCSPLNRQPFSGPWLSSVRFSTGLLLFLFGFIINVHSDQILRCLRKPGEVVYRIPYGGMFEWVSCPNYFGEIVEWFGLFLASWSLTVFSFFFFTLCSIGPRAIRHHRDYQRRFPDYPSHRKAFLPFLL